MIEAGGDMRRALAWEHGILCVERRGGMLGPVLFLLPDGRQIAPLQVAPWFSEPEAQALPGLMPRLRGEWLCVPFGFDVDRPSFGEWPATHKADAIDEGHGHGANRDWTFDGQPDTEIALSIDYPANHPIQRMTRRPTPDPFAAAIDIELGVHPRQDCLLPIGVHPTFRLPSRSGDFEIAIEADREIATFPGDLDASSILARGRFAPISEVPMRDGSTLDVRRVPFSVNTEELVQVLQGGGQVDLVNHAENYKVRLSWNAEHFPSLLLWFSNRGRTSEPWNSRHLALGVEPICSAFDLGVGVSSQANPLNDRGIRTAQRFNAGEAWATQYRIEVLPAGAKDG